MPRKTVKSQIKAIKGQCQPLDKLDKLDFLSYLIDFLKQGREHPEQWDGRRYGSVVSWAKLFADVQAWIPKTPINLTQQVAVKANDEDKIISDFVDSLPSELRNGILTVARKERQMELASTQ